MQQEGEVLPSTQRVWTRPTLDLATTPSWSHPSGDVNTWLSGARIQGTVDIRVELYRGRSVPLMQVGDWFWAQQGSPEQSSGYCILRDRVDAVHHGGGKGWVPTPLTPLQCSQYHVSGYSNSWGRVKANWAPVALPPPKQGERRWPHTHSAVG